MNLEKKREKNIKNMKCDSEYRGIALISRLYIRQQNSLILLIYWNVTLA